MLFTNLLQRTLGESNSITPRRASRFEDAGAFATEEAPVELPASAPQAALDREPSVSARPPAPGVERPDPILAEKLMALVVSEPAPALPVKPPSMQPVREVPAAPLIVQAITPPPSAPSAAKDDPLIHEIRTEVRQEPVRERIRETRSERFTIEKRLETLRIETLRERVMEQRPVTAVEARPAPPPRSMEKLPGPAAVQRRNTIREVHKLSPSRLAAQTAGPVTTPEPPSVSVTIGRVEIRAVAKPAPRASASPRGPKQSLAEYLDRREGA